MTKSTCYKFLQLLCGFSSRKGEKVQTPDEMKVKIRLGFDGKDTLLDPKSLNVRATFGCFAVLLEYSNNRIIPLNRDGFALEPLDVRKRYVVVLNTHGSSQKKWEVQRGGKHKTKHSSKKKSKKSKKHKPKKEKVSLDCVGAEMSVIVSHSGSDFATKEFAAASTQALLSPDPISSNSDDNIF